MKTSLIITWIFIFYLSLGMEGQAQSITLTFSGIKDGQTVMLDRIEIQNLDKGCDTTLYYPAASLALQPLGIGDLTSDPAGFTVFQNVPNPAVALTTIRVYQPVTGQVSVVVTEMTGQQVASFSGELHPGYHLFEFTPGNSEAYIFSAYSSGIAESIKIVSGSHRGSQPCILSYTGIASGDETLKSAFPADGFTFSLGDHLSYTGHYNTFTSVIEDAPQSNMSYTFDFSATGTPCPGIPSVTYGGQVYHTVLIGTQCWFKENLNIGTWINSNKEQTNNEIIEKYCYNNDTTICNTYGGLYQWDEMMQYINTAGAKGICPIGWHIPTDAEWTTLTTYLGGELVAGGKMKETGTAHWYSPNTGATNSSGFTALPGGVCYLTGNFNGLETNAIFWSSSQSVANYAWYRLLYNANENVSRDEYHNPNGISCRCLQD